MKIEWVGDFRIEVSLDIDNAVVISANRDGLLSLARQLTTLADEPVGFHIHYDDYNSLEDGSINVNRKRYQKIVAGVMIAVSLWLIVSNIH